MAPVPQGIDLYSLSSTSSGESDRRAELGASGILDSGRDSAFDALVDFASRLFDVPICLISLVDEKRQWFKAVIGLDMYQTPRPGAFCDHVVSNDALLCVEDATLDARFGKNGFFGCAQGVRFYAGAPIRVRSGVAIGSFCILDTKPRQLSEKQQRMLADLADLAMRLIEGHRLARESAEHAAESHRQRLLLEAQSRDLQLRERQFKQTEGLSKVGGWEFDLSGDIIHWSDEVYRICEIELGTPIDLELALSVYPDHERERLVRLIERARSGNGSYNEAFEIVTASGNRKWIRTAGDVERVDGVCTRLFGIFQDISDQHLADLELWRAANQDSLTGLANRAQFTRILGELFERQTHPSVGLLMIDVDHLKEVNDTLGHESGDILLQTVASRLGAAVGSAGLVARIGGDEFVLTLTEEATPERLASLGHDIIAAMGTRLSVLEHTITPQVSIGGATAGPEDTAETLRQNADLALYHTKQTCRGGYTEFRETMRTTILRRINSLREVEESLAVGRMLPFYQPIVRLDTAEIVGLEALARMRLPDGRIVVAGEFHEALNDSKIGPRLTVMMLRTVARDIRSWLDDGFPFQHVGVNVTTADFQRGDLRQRVADAFAEFDVPVRHLVLEVTESVFMNGSDRMVTRGVENVRRDGLLVALDDFGTGYASLSHLREVPVDIIKIDRSFIAGMSVDASSAPIIEALIDLTSKLGMRLIAEGIETEAQVCHLRDLGCSLGQGFHFAKAQSAAITRDLLFAFGQHRGRATPPASVANKTA